MSASLVGSEMCIRDRLLPLRGHPTPNAARRTPPVQKANSWPGTGATRDPSRARAIVALNLL
eukprot:12366082-Alexandrium_andersonii.AAC.1